ncbi:hypothetical protein LNKW23_45740 [Paralimibaculum aggregatum]|uniref:Transposase n=1 Tax=Paralimibaculum aggregatum TaxID=3036245 RepID=A0ABQ6LTF2_9RHOB|nr:hypothetical protein LNKW23_45740 [Limibaculum sp. NKW23]
MAELCRRHGISDATFYKWRSRYDGKEVLEARRLKSLKSENAKLKRLLADAMHDVSTLREVLGKDFRRPGQGEMPCPGPSPRRGTRRGGRADSSGSPRRPTDTLRGGRTIEC